jgi:hypothetical protein
MPEYDLRYKLWSQLIPQNWLDKIKAEEFLQKISEHKISGGSMINVIQNCAIKLFKSENINEKENEIYNIFTQAIAKELKKEGKIINNLS